jgi:hypothetical protein
VRLSLLQSNYIVLKKAIVFEFSTSFSHGPMSRSNSLGCGVKIVLELTDLTNFKAIQLSASASRTNGVVLEIRNLMQCFFVLAPAPIPGQILWLAV